MHLLCQWNRIGTCDVGLAWIPLSPGNTKTSRRIHRSLHSHRRALFNLIWILNLNVSRQCYKSPSLVWNTLGDCFRLDLLQFISVHLWVAVGIVEHASLNYVDKDSVAALRTRSIYPFYIITPIRLYFLGGNFVVIIISYFLKEDCKNYYYFENSCRPIVSR